MRFNIFRIVIFLVIIFLRSNLNSQKYNKHSVELSLGNHSLVTQTESVAKSLNFLNFQSSYRYSFSNKFGLSVGLFYDRFVWNNERTPSHLWKIGISPTFNLTEITGISEVNSKFGLLLDFGVGLGTLRNKDVLVTRNVLGSEMKIGPDRLWSMNVGLSPQYSIKSNLALFTKFSFNVNFKQQFFLDLNKTVNSTDKIGSSFLSSHIGIRYYVGNNPKHADWFPSPKLQKEDIYRLLSLESQVELLQMKLEDYDGDGVINLLDLEPNTVAGSKVDERGVTIKEKTSSVLDQTSSFTKSQGIDTTGLDALIKEKLERQVSRSNKDSDGDGFPDDIDLCPDLKGVVKGCPDSDGDEIPDVLDKCPNEKGLNIYSGCMEPWKDTKLGERITTETITTERIIKENFIAAKPKNEVNIDTLNLKKLGIHEIFFATGSVELSLESMDKLNKLIALMKDNPKLKISVIGYADNSGNPQNNENFARKRASESVKYMVQQGIESERIIQSHKVVPSDSKNASKLRKASFSIQK